MHHRSSILRDLPLASTDQLLQFLCLRLIGYESKANDSSEREAGAKQHVRSGLAMP